MNDDIRSLFGLPIFLDPTMDKIIPARKHRKRRNQTFRYHERIQKKWMKRYGYMVDEKIMEYTSPLTGVRMLAMSPQTWERFKKDQALMEAQRNPNPELLLRPDLPRRRA